MTNGILAFLQDETRRAKTFGPACTLENATKFVGAFGKRTISKKTIFNFLPRYPWVDDCAR
jgi:hypothetical protein